jgi:putrescine aminotransferase
VLLVADEVITGFGRTGRWFGCETFGIQPDFMTVAKAITSGYLPLSAAVVGERVATTLASKGGRLAHGYTYSGHPVSCAVGVAALRIIAEEGLVDRTREETGPYLERCLHEAFDDHPLVGEVRGVGLLFAVELVKDKAAAKLFEPVGEVGLRCLSHCFDNGLVLRAVRDAMCFCPPLVIQRSEIDEMVEKARRSIDQTAKEVGVA